MTGAEFVASFIILIIISIIAAFTANVYCFFRDVPKELKRIADVLEKGK